MLIDEGRGNRGCSNMAGGNVIVSNSNADVGEVTTGVPVGGLSEIPEPANDNRIVVRLRVQLASAHTPNKPLDDDDELEPAVVALIGALAESAVRRENRRANRSH